MPAQHPGERSRDPQERYRAGRVRGARRALAALAPAPASAATCFAERVELAAINATRGVDAIRNPRVAPQSIALTIASWVVPSLSYWILMQGFAIDVPFAAALLVTVTINIGLVLPSSPAAIGVFEAATVIALVTFDIPRAEALSYALVLHLLNLIPFLLAGAALLGPGALRRRGRDGR